MLFRYLLPLFVAQSCLSVPAPISFRSSGIDKYSFPTITVRGVESNLNPEPIRGSTGASILGPQNIPVEVQNLALLAPPATDNGNIGNLKWPFSLSRMRLENGGWARQQTVKDVPTATDISGVNMRLEPGAIRELHWHTANEWAYVLSGTVRISTVNPDGLVFVGDVSQGDLWYFPSGNPHSLQATNTTHGAEFLLIFDTGSFEEENTFLLTDWLSHIPKDVLAKNFGTGTDISPFDNIPTKELYIFKGTPPPDNVESDQVVPNDTKNPNTFPLSQVTPTKTPGGSIKRIDSTSFTIAQAISAVEAEVDVGGMRELHWHPTQPEWTYFIAGQARMTIFASSSNAQTYNFQAGDVAYIPPSFGHYIENTGSEPLKFLEVFKSALAQDISLTQWLALTPHELVKAHLGFSDEFISKMSREKQEVVL